MKSICGANCENCGYGKDNNCKGCKNTNGERCVRIDGKFICK